MSAERLADLRRFYDALDRLSQRVGGARLLGDGPGPIGRTARGVYFFFEPGEIRSDSGEGLRVVRVGTHGLKAGSKSTLWQRLSQHRGTHDGHGNQRGSIFRRLVGNAMLRRGGIDLPSWGEGSSAPPETRLAERPLEMRVSAYLGSLPYLWLVLDDEPGPASLRGYVERNAIALLSNCGKEPLDPASQGWLGRSSTRERVRESGLWNNEHVADGCDPGFLDQLERIVGG
jgi:hypothetical protein